MTGDTPCNQVGSDLKTNRREFIQTGVLAAGMMLANPIPACADVPPKKRPNLIFILNEGQRADALSIAGHPILKTPNQDRIAREGVRFANAFCTKALCAPNGVAIPKPSTFDDDLKGWPGKPKPFIQADNKIGSEVTQSMVRSLEELCKDYYAGSVAIDENVGRILKYLDEAGKTDDTAIVVGSDHGFFLGEWRLYDKRLMHEPSIRVPLMIRYPLRVPSATTRNETVLDVDIAPTILDLCGVSLRRRCKDKAYLS